MGCGGSAVLSGTPFDDGDDDDDPQSHTDPFRGENLGKNWQYTGAYALGASLLLFLLLLLHYYKITITSIII